MMFDKTVLAEQATLYKLKASGCSDCCLSSMLRPWTLCTKLYIFVQTLKRCHYWPQKFRNGQRLVSLQTSMPIALFESSAAAEQSICSVLHIITANRAENLFSRTVPVLYRPNTQFKGEKIQKRISTSFAKSCNYSREWLVQNDQIMCSSGRGELTKANKILALPYESRQIIKHPGQRIGTQTFLNK